MTRLVSVSGGDICDAFRGESDDGSVIFIKKKNRAPAGFFEAEARGLSLLSEVAGGRLLVPKVLSYDSEQLVLEWLQFGPRNAKADEALGRGLAELHRATLSDAQRERAQMPGFIGPLPLFNQIEEGVAWSEFFWEHRLRPFLQGLTAVPREVEQNFDTLSLRLKSFGVDEEPLSLVHGDMWSGNAGAVGTQPALFDPSSHLAHREVDLAMMALFGGFSETVWGAYQEAYPLHPGFSERKDLYQLYPVLVHWALFGSSYCTMVQERIERLL
ncbi:MAG: fructosamine kinase family protein [Polyangiaceae bacterium]|nr:fructosamine kinase family protein [Polyangiaceae bacterium]